MLYLVRDIDPLGGERGGDVYGDMGDETVVLVVVVGGACGGLAVGEEEAGAGADGGHEGRACLVWAL